MADYVLGDKIGRDKNVQYGSGARIYSGDAAAGQELLVDAVRQLTETIRQLQAGGLVDPAGRVTDPASVVNAVQARRSHLAALTRAIAAGSKDAILSVVKGGVSELIVAVLGGPAS